MKQIVLVLLALVLLCTVPVALRGVDMSQQKTFISQPLLKKLNKQNYVTRLEKVEAKAGPKPSAKVGDLSQLSPDLGDQVAGTFFAVDPATGVIRGYLTATPREDHSGYYFALFDTLGNLQIGGDADTGKWISGGGDVTLGDDGEIVNSYLPIEFHGTEYGGYIFTDDVGKLTLISVAQHNGTNLILDPGFESGGWASWVASLGTSAEIVSDHVHSGARALKTYVSLNDYNVVSSRNYFDVTAGHTYIFQCYTDRQEGGTYMRVDINYYDSGDVLLSTDTVFELSRQTAGWQRCIGKPSIAPAGAVHAKLHLVSGTYENAWLDDFSLVDAGDYVVWMQGTGTGWKAYKAGVETDLTDRPKTSGFYADEIVTSVANFNRTIDATYPYGFYYMAPSSDCADGDEYFGQTFIAAGTYSLHTAGRIGPGNGIVDYYIDDVLVRSGQDWYAAAGAPAEKKSDNISIAASGYHQIKIKLNGTNGSSWRLGVTKVWFVPASY